MNDPKTADQINSQVLGYADSQTLHEINEVNRYHMKRNIALRLLVEKWRNEAESSHWDYFEKLGVRRCAKELEDIISQ